jgi:metallophosphoesterase (TIGR00282 family)
VRILFIGDIVGRPGRDVLRERLAHVRSRYDADVVIANAENAAGGTGLTPDIAGELFSEGVDLITLGNHAWARREIREVLDEPFPPILRPLNYHGSPPGRGSAVLEVGGRKVAVISVAGRVFATTHYDCPFRTCQAEVERLRRITPVIIVDAHGEATSEKAALAWYLDGRVTAVIGTHTHVQTADERILPGGTAFITDVGLTGPVDGVIGMDRHLALERFLTQLPVRLEVADGPAVFSAVLIEVDPDLGKARSIRRVRELGGDPFDTD